MHFIYSVGFTRQGHILTKQQLKKNSLHGVQWQVVGLPSYNWVDWLVVGFKADCLTRDLGLWVEGPPWGSFYWILVRI